MTKIIGKISPKEIKKRETIMELRQSRRIKSSGNLIGSAIITNIKSIPGISWARCDIRSNKGGLFATRDGVFIRPVKAGIVHDNSFKSL